MKIAKAELHVDEMIVRQRAIARHDPEQPSGLKTAHPSDDGISFIRVVTGCMDQGSLKLYRSSHHQLMEEFDQFKRSMEEDQISPVKAEEPILGPDRVLVLHGALKWEFNPPPGCMIVWVGFSKSPMQGNTQSPHALRFMAKFRGSVTLPPVGTRVRKGKIKDITFH